MEHVLIVDGYNIIGAWPQLRKLKDIDFSEARDRLIEKLAEFQSYTGYQVIVVFDAHLVSGTESKIKHHKVEVIFTKENETADERIERMVNEKRNARTKVHVATSDSTEQFVTFGQGALRFSARDLLREIQEIEQEIKSTVEKHQKKSSTAKINIPAEIAEIFEKMRRRK